MMDLPIFWGGEGRSCPLKIDTSIDEDIEWQSKYQIRKDLLKNKKMRKLNATEKFI